MKYLATLLMGIALCANAETNVVESVETPEVVTNAPVCVNMVWGFDTNSNAIIQFQFDKALDEESAVTNLNVALPAPILRRTVLVNFCDMFSHIWQVQPREDQSEDPTIRKCAICQEEQTLEWR